MPSHATIVLHKQHKLQHGTSAQLMDEVVQAVGMISCSFMYKQSILASVRGTWVKVGHKITGQRGGDLLLVAIYVQ